MELREEIGSKMTASIPFTFQNKSVMSDVVNLYFPALNLYYRKRISAKLGMHASSLFEITVGHRCILKSLSNINDGADFHQSSIIDVWEDS